MTARKNLSAITGDKNRNQKYLHHACSELMRRQGWVPKVICFGLQSGSPRSQG